MKKKKAYRNYRGVKIYRVKRMICGSDFEVKYDGTLVDRGPTFQIYYRYADGPLCYTLEECQIDIDGMINVAKEFTPMMVEELNSGEDLD